MRRAVAILFVGSLALTGGCASTRQYVAMPDQAKTIEDPNLSRIYVMRPAFVGFAIPMSVYDGEKKIGKTGAKGYLCWEREPGEAEIRGKAENTSSLSLSLDQGVSYYIQQHVRLGFLVARNKLELLEKAEGQDMLKKCKQPQVEIAE